MTEIEIDDGLLRFEVEQPDRLDHFLTQVVPGHSRTKLNKLIEAGLVLVNDSPQTKSGHKLAVGNVVEFPEPLDQEAHDLTPFPLDLIVPYEDEYLIVVEKPRGLASHPALSLKEPSLVNVLLARGGALSAAGGDFRPGIVHRLDKDTTGLMVVAKSDAVHVALAKQFETKQAERRYVGVVAGEPNRTRFDIDAAIARDPKNRQRMTIDQDGKSALTHCKVIALIDAGTLMAFRLSTGRTHQIRVHLKAIGHPILGDRIYAPPAYHDLPLQLHAAYLAFDHPVHKKRVETFALPPEDFVGRDKVTEATVAWDDMDNR